MKFEHSPYNHGNSGHGRIYSKETKPFPMNDPRLNNPHYDADWYLADGIRYETKEEFLAAITVTWWDMLRHPVRSYKKLFPTLPFDWVPGDEI